MNGAAHKRGDPLAGLSGWEKRQLILQWPTWSERWRMSEPFQTKEEKLAILIDIMWERRDLYDKHFAMKVEAAARMRAEQRYTDRELAVTDFGAYVRRAFRGSHEERQRRDRLSPQYRDAYLERRDDQWSREDDHQR